MISVDNVWVSIGKNPVLKGFHTQFETGSISVVLGRSGCGKSTLLRTLAGFTTVDKGSVTIDGSEVASAKVNVVPRKRGIAMVFQELALWPHMTAYEHLEFTVAPGRHADPRAVIMESLAATGLAGFSKRFPNSMSGGERQRLALARALAAQSRCILLDEPFGSLDEITRDAMLSLTKEVLRTRGVTMVYVTHAIDEARALADQCIVMRNGRAAMRYARDAFLSLSRNDILHEYDGKD
jgi:iron(III) transport system ATP-binding protein